MEASFGTDEVEVLARSLGRFETRLFRGMLVARALLPAITALTLVLSSLKGGLPIGRISIWIALAVWMLATGAFAWQRLRWVRTFPFALRLEIAAMCSFVVLGLGARDWHVMHMFVPVTFAAFFLPRRASRSVTIATVVAIWLPALILAVRPQTPLEPQIGATTPSLLVVVAGGLLTYIRLLFADADLLVAALRENAVEIASALRGRARLAQRAAAERAIMVKVRSRIATIRDADEALEAAVDETLQQIASETNEVLGREDELLGSSTLGEEVFSAIARTRGLGATVELDHRDPIGQVRIAERHRAAVGRVLIEAIANARRHGRGSVRVDLGTDGDRVTVLVTNQAATAPAPRVGGFGLGDLAEDAATVGATVTHGFTGGMVTTSISLPGTNDEAPALPTAELTGALEGRRAQFVRGILLARLGVAVLAAVMIQVKASVHPNLMPILTVTSVLLIVYHGSCVLGYRWVGTAIDGRPALVLVDLLVTLVILLGEGGMASPWIPASFGTIMVVGYGLGFRGVAFGVVTCWLAQKAGLALLLARGINDPGAAVQTVYGWVVNLVGIVVVGAIAWSIHWVFTQMSAASRAHARSLTERFEAERAAQDAAGRAEARRSIHSQPYALIRAAREIAERHGSRRTATALRDLEAEVASAMGELDGGWLRHPTH